MKLEEYFIRLQDGLGKVNAADEIKEELWWNSVIRELNEISRDIAEELQRETQVLHLKDGYGLPLRKSPPARLLSMEIALAHWLGWVMQEKQPNKDQPFSAPDCLCRINRAFMAGVEMSLKKKHP